MIRLSQICFIAFLAALGFYLYQAYNGLDDSLGFLMAGAAGCVYLLLRTEQRYTQHSRQRETKTKAKAKQNPSKRIAPENLGTVQIVERRAAPTLGRSEERPFLSSKG